MAEKKHSRNSGNSGKKSSSRSVPSNKKQASGRPTAADRAVHDVAVEQSGIPVRIVSAIVCFALAVLFLVVLLKPDGYILLAVQNVMQGLFGKVGFYISIPTLLFACYVLLVNRKTPIAMQLICAVLFAILCGTLSHVAMNPVLNGNFFVKVRTLYRGGCLGTSGGVICGVLGMLVRMLFGSIYSYIVLVVGMILTLLASFRITVFGILRAIRSFHEEEDEEDEEFEPVDHSAAFVNTIVQKREEMNRRRMEHEELQRIRQMNAERAENPEPRRKRKNKEKSDFMSEISVDPCEPICAERTIQEKIAPEMDEPVQNIPAEMPADIPIPVTPEPVLTQMPPLVPEAIADPVPAASVDVPKKVTSKEAATSAQQVAQEIAQGAMAEKVEYCYPPIDLLGKPSRNVADGTDEMRENSRRLNETLASFKIEAHIVNVTRGPSVTRYEVELEKGVRLNKLTGSADDIALSLGASGVRIAAVPGKIAVVGIEVPNRTVTTVTLREVIDSPEFKKAKSKSSFAVGKDIGGSCIVGNIAKLPHMLIAGTTGSGKSVCMNSIIISLLYKSSPEEVKLIMVDPKMVELGIYNGIPHLLIPVVTDPKKAAGSLQWAVSEMLRRYRAMSDLGVRDLESYNSIIESQGEDGEKLPQVVVIIDELADLMLVAAKEVEESICRIAQMGRAAGIHLIIATQRPSADVITGLMKANIPSRIAFAVASAMESRIILDTQGAEKLVGKGDMLYAPIGSGKPLRVQGCFVTDSEVESVATYIKEHYTTEYDEKVMEEIEQKAAQAGTGKPSGGSDTMPNADEQAYDELLPAAVDVVLETGQASVSMLQRRLKLGYARAARIVDEMEEMGVVGPFQGSKPRTILVTKEQWASMQGSPAPEQPQMDFQDFDVEPENPGEDFS